MYNIFDDLEYFDVDYTDNNNKVKDDVCKRLQILETVNDDVKCKRE